MISKINYSIFDNNGMIKLFSEVDKESNKNNDNNNNIDIDLIFFPIELSP